METWDKKIRRFTRTEERSVATHFTLLKTWSILRMLKGTNCWQFFDFLDFFLFFSNSKVKVLSKFCILFVIYFPEIHLWVSLYFWRVTHKYKLARRVDLAKNFEVLIFFFFCYQTSLYFEHCIRSLAISRKLELTVIMF